MRINRDIFMFHEQYIDTNRSGYTDLIGTFSAIQYLYELH
jgi:hypothetical protein